MAGQQDPPPDDEPDDQDAPNLGKAYVELSQRLGNPGVDGETLKRIGEGFRRQSGISKIRGLLDDQLMKSIPKYEPVEMPVIKPDTRPSEIAAHTKRTAKLIGEQNAAIAQLVNLTINNLALSEKQQEQSKRTEKFSRRMTWTSVILTTATVGVSVAALCVSLASG